MARRESPSQPPAGSAEHLPRDGRAELRNPAELASADGRSGALSGDGKTEALEGDSKAEPIRADSEPDKLSDLPKRSWPQILKRTGREFMDDNLTDWAAALTYYSVLSIFPALLALIAILGLVGSTAIEPMIDNFGSLAPGPARDLLISSLDTLQQNQRGAGLLTFIGIAVALWSASGYIGAFMRASNAVYDIPEGRPIWKTLPVRLAITVVMVILLAISAMAVVFTGDVATRAGELLGVGETGLQVWNIAKWPVLVLIVALMLALLYWAAPNVRHPAFRWITPGSAVAVLLWIIASAGFGFYVANFGSYNKTYGTIAGVIVFLIWLWVTNIAVLFGVELDSELARERSIQSGRPASQEPYVEARDTTKFRDSETNSGLA